MVRRLIAAGLAAALVLLSPGLEPYRVLAGGLPAGNPAPVAPGWEAALGAFAGPLQAYSAQQYANEPGAPLLHFSRLNFASRRDRLLARSVFRALEARISPKAFTDEPSAERKRQWVQAALDQAIAREGPLWLEDLRLASQRSEQSPTKTRQAVDRLRRWFGDPVRPGNGVVPAGDGASSFSADPTAAPRHPPPQPSSRRPFDSAQGRREEGGAASDADGSRMSRLLKELEAAREGHRRELDFTPTAASLKILGRFSFEASLWSRVALRLPLTDSYPGLLKSYGIQADLRSWRAVLTEGIDFPPQPLRPGPKARGPPVSLHRLASIGMSAALFVFTFYRLATDVPRKDFYAQVAHPNVWQQIDVRWLNDFLTVPFAGAAAYLLSLPWIDRSGQTPERKFFTKAVLNSSLLIAGLSVFAELMSRDSGGTDVFDPIDLGLFLSGPVVVWLASKLLWWPQPRGPSPPSDIAVVVPALVFALGFGMMLLFHSNAPLLIPAGVLFALLPVVALHFEHRRPGNGVAPSQNTRPDEAARAAALRKEILAAASKYAETRNPISRLRGKESSLIPAAASRGGHVVSLGSGPDIFRPLYDFPLASDYHLVDGTNGWGVGPGEVIYEFIERVKAAAGGADVKVVRKGFAANVPQEMIKRAALGDEKRPLSPEYWKRWEESPAARAPLIISIRWHSAAGPLTKTFWLHPVDYDRPEHVAEVLAAIPAGEGLAGVLLTGAPVPAGANLFRILGRMSPDAAFLLEAYPGEEAVVARLRRDHALTMVPEDEEFFAPVRFKPTTYLVRRRAPLLPAEPGEGGRRPAEGRGRDVGQEYRQTWERARESFSPAESQALKGYKVLFVNGLLADAYLEFGEYFDDSLAALRDASVDAGRVATNAEAPSAANLEAIARAITASDKPVLLVTHSKGGIDVLHALLERPELRSRVAAWAPLQAPFLGSPVADALLEHSLPRAAMSGMLSYWGGGLESLRELSTAARRNYMARNADAIRALTRDLPVLSVATWKEREPWRWDSLLKAGRDYLLRRGQKSDGLVPIESAVLPGSDFSVIKGIDHAVPVMPSRFLDFDSPRFTRAVVTMLLARAQIRDAAAPRSQTHAK